MYIVIIRVHRTDLAVIWNTYYTRVRGNHHAVARIHQPEAKFVNIREAGTSAEAAVTLPLRNATHAYTHPLSARSTVSRPNTLT